MEEIMIETLRLSISLVKQVPILRLHLLVNEGLLKTEPA
jgi:hypothetical protein